MYHSTMKIPWYIIMVGTNHYLDTKIWYMNMTIMQLSHQIAYLHMYLN